MYVSELRTKLRKLDRAYETGAIYYTEYVTHAIIAIMDSKKDHGVAMRINRTHKEIMNAYQELSMLRQLLKVG